MTPTDTTSLTSPPPHPLSSSSSTLRTFTSTTIPTSIPPSPHSTLPCAMNHTRIHPLHSSIVIPHRPLIAPALGLVHLPSVRRDPPVAIVGPTPSPRTFQALVPRPDPTPTPLSSPAAETPWAASSSPTVPVPPQTITSPPPIPSHIPLVSNMPTPTRSIPSSPTPHRPRHRRTILIPLSTAPARPAWAYPPPMWRHSTIYPLEVSPHTTSHLPSPPRRSAVTPNPRPPPLHPHRRPDTTIPTPTSPRNDVDVANLTMLSSAEGGITLMSVSGNWLALFPASSLSAMAHSSCRVPRHRQDRHPARTFRRTCLRWASWATLVCDRVCCVELLFTDCGV